MRSRLRMSLMLNCLLLRWQFLLQNQRRFSKSFLQTLRSLTMHDNVCCFTFTILSKSIRRFLLCIAMVLLSFIYLKIVDAFLESIRHDFAHEKLIDAQQGVDERTARNAAVEYCLEHHCDYLFVVESIAHLTNADALKTLIEIDRCTRTKRFITPS